MIRVSLLTLILFAFGKCGFAQSEFTICVEPIYDSIENINTQFAKLMRNDSSTYYDKVNNKIYKHLYDEVKTFPRTSNFTIAKSHDKFFHIDQNGIPIYEETYDECYHFMNGYAFVTEGKKSFIIDTLGTVKFKKKNVKVRYFNHEVVLIDKKGKKRLVNYKNETLLKDSLNVIYSRTSIDKSPLFYIEKPEGYLFVTSKGEVKDEVYRGFIYTESGKIIAESNGKAHLLDGNLDVEFTFDSYHHVDGGRPNLKNDSILYLYRGKKFALFNLFTGKATSFSYDRLSLGHPNVVITKTGIRCGLISTQGEVINENLGESISRGFGSKWMRVQGDNYVFLVDAQGNTLFHPDDGVSNYKSIDIINDSLFKVSENHLLKGMVDASGKVLIPLEYTLLESPFKNGIAKAMKKSKTENKHFAGFVNAKGNFWHSDFKGKRYVGKGYGYVIRNDTCLMIDSNFKTFMPIDSGYSQINTPRNGLIRAKKHGRYGYIDTNGNVAIELKYRVARNFRNGFALVNYKTFINEQGEEIVHDVAEFSETKTDFNLSKTKYRGKWGLYHRDRDISHFDFDLLIPFEYDHISIINEHLVIVKRNNRYSIMNTSGEVVVEEQDAKFKFLGRNICYLDDETKELYNLEHDSAIALGLNYHKQLRAKVIHPVSLELMTFLSVESDNKFGIVRFHPDLFDQ